MDDASKGVRENPTLKEGHEKLLVDLIDVLQQIADKQTGKSELTRLPVLYDC